MKYKTVTRNYKDVQHGLVRENIEQPYTDFHDSLSKNYYENRNKEEKEPFIYDGINYGILTKDVFDTLHAKNEVDRQKAVMTDIVVIDDYINGKGKKPKYLTHSECQIVASKLKPDELREIKTKLDTITNIEVVK